MSQRYCKQNVFHLSALRYKINTFCKQFLIANLLLLHMSNTNSDKYSSLEIREQNSTTTVWINLLFSKSNLFWKMIFSKNSLKKNNHTQKNNTPFHMLRN